MRDTERDLLESHIIALESELAALRETARALVENVAELAAERDDRRYEQSVVRMAAKVVAFNSALELELARITAERDELRLAMEPELVSVGPAEDGSVAEAVAGLKERLQILLGKARPVPKAEEPGTAGVLICLSDSEWQFVKGTP